MTSEQEVEEEKKDDKLDLVSVNDEEGQRVFKEHTIIKKKQLMYICICRHVFHCTMTDFVQNEKTFILITYRAFICKGECFRIFYFFWNC